MKFYRVTATIATSLDPDTQIRMDVEADSIPDVCKQVTECLEEDFGTVDIILVEEIVTRGD